VAARGAECRTIGTLGDVAAAGRTLDKTAYDTPGLARFAAQRPVFDLAAFSTQIDASGFRLLLPAAIANKPGTKNRSSHKN